MNPFFSNFRLFLGRLSGAQKIALAIVVLGAIGLLSGIATWAGKPDYALLFGRLDPSDASKVVESLRSQGTPYQLREGGTAIFVPREDVYELRLRFAGEGMVSDGPTGYELFDRGTLGMTDFMQKLNLKRALEGELARTISSIRQVETSRVHLVIPERSPFRDSQAQPTASVVIQTSGSARLSGDQIQGITSLVAGAVEGLAPASVTVLDTRGNLLSNPESTDPQAIMGSTQLRVTRSVETHLMEKGQSMLDRVLGGGNSIVRVAASLDFSRSVEEREMIDPESATVVSEEQLDETNVGGNATASSSVRNYELNRTRERLEKSVGDIKYLTVSVILNQRRGASGAAQATEQEAYSAVEISEIESLVKNAVGFDAARGDQFAIHQTRFDTSVDEQLAVEISEQITSERTALYLRYGLMVLALVLAVWLLRSASKRVNLDEIAPLQLRGGAGHGRELRHSDVAGLVDEGDSSERDEELLLVDDVYTSKLSAEAKRRLKAKHLMYEEIKTQAENQPADAVDLIRAWMLSDTRPSPQ